MKIENNVLEFYERAGLDLSSCKKIEEPLSKEILIDDEFVSLDDFLIENSIITHEKSFTPTKIYLNFSERPMYFKAYSGVTHNGNAIGLVESTIVTNKKVSYIDSKKAIDNPYEAATEGYLKFFEEKNWIKYVASTMLQETETKNTLYIKEKYANNIVDPEIDLEIEKKEESKIASFKKNSKIIYPFHKGLTSGTKLIFEMPELYKSVKEKTPKFLNDYLKGNLDKRSVFSSAAGFVLSAGAYISMLIEPSALIFFPIATNYASAINKSRRNQNER